MLISHNLLRNAPWLMVLYLELASKMVTHVLLRDAPVVHAPLGKPSLIILTAQARSN